MHLVVQPAAFGWPNASGIRLYDGDTRKEIQWCKMTKRFAGAVSSQYSLLPPSGFDTDNLQVPAYLRMVAQQVAGASLPEDGSAARCTFFVVIFSGVSLHIV